ncbi:hypothetical protein PO909_005894 [Leuciscus waleckii]
MTISVLRSRLAFVREGGVPITTPHPRVPCGMGDRSIIVMASLPGNQSQWAPHSSTTPQHRRVYHAKALMDMHEGCPDRALFAELCTATDPPPARRQGRPPAAASAPTGPPQKPQPKPQHGASRRQMVPVPVLELSKEQIPLFLGPNRARLAVCDPVKPCTPQPPLVSPAGSWVRFEDPTTPSHAHPANQWRQVSVASHTQTPLWAAPGPSEPGPCPPPRCPTLGTSEVPLVPQAQFVEAWRVLPNRSSWLLSTI